MISGCTIFCNPPSVEFGDNNHIMVARSCTLIDNDWCYYEVMNWWSKKWETVVTLTKSSAIQLIWMHMKTAKWIKLEIKISDVLWVWRAFFTVTHLSQVRQQFVVQNEYGKKTKNRCTGQNARNTEWSYYNITEKHWWLSLSWGNQDR